MKDNKKKKKGTSQQRMTSLFSGLSGGLVARIPGFHPG